MAAIIDYRGKSPTKTTAGIPLITAKIIKGGRIEPAEEFIAEASYESWMSRGMPREGDVVLTTEAPLGEVAQLDGSKVALAQRVITLRGKPGLMDQNYLRYLLQSAPVQDELLSRATGTTVLGIRQSELRKVPLSFPKYQQQVATGAFLRSLDDKIELNRRMSQTLEAIAQAIFKSWFVDSTPDGAQPSTLKDLTTKIGSGATPRGGREVYVEEGVALIRSQNVYDSQFVWDGLARITDDAARQLANVEVKASDVLLNITGASILRTCVVPPDVLPARVNQHVAIIRAKAGVSPHYLHLHLLQPDTKAYLLGLNAGASREAVTKAHIESVPVLDPGADWLARFDAAVMPLFAQAQACAAEARSLAALRDTLLPRLLSGEFPIPAAA